MDASQKLRREEFDGSNNSEQRTEKQPCDGGGVEEQHRAACRLINQRAIHLLHLSGRKGNRGNGF